MLFRNERQISKKSMSVILFCTIGLILCRGVARGGGEVRPGCHPFGDDTHPRFKKLKIYKNFKRNLKNRARACTFCVFVHMNFETSDCVSRTDVCSHLHLPLYVEFDAVAARQLTC